MTAQEQQEENKNKRSGILITVGVHAILLLLFFLVEAWRMPNPPPPGLPGIEINFGSVDAGMGDEQTSQEETQEIPIEEIIPQEVLEEATINDEKVVTSNVESPHEVKEVEKNKEVKKEKVDPVKEKKQEVADAKNAFPNKNSASDGDKDKKGDQGKPEGNPDSRNMYSGGKGNQDGNGPGGIGASMDLPGWQWDSKPDKIDPTSESGYVLFEFYIDEEGTVISAKKLQGANLTPSEDNFYKKQLLETSFHLKDSRAKPAPKTRGVFRFEVRSK